MAIDNSNKAIIAFKNLLGKSQTDSSKELGNEAENISLNLTASNIFTDIIDQNPATAISAGIAVFVIGDFVEDLTSNGHGWFLTWPSTPPSGTDPTTASPYSYGNGLLTGISSSDRIINSIAPNLGGSSYEILPKDSGSSIISPGDPRDWIFQYNSGILWQQDNVGLDPITAEIYAYTGNTLADSSIGGTELLTIDDKFLSSLATSTDGDIVSSAGISNTPVDDSYVTVFINGIEYEVGNGISTKDCYFADPISSPIVPRGFSSTHPNGQVQAGDKLYWNGSIAGFELQTGWRISFHYLIN